MKIILYTKYIHLVYMPHALATLRTAHQDWGLFRNHLFPSFGAMPLNAITRADIVRFVSEKRAAGLKSSTCNRILAKLKASFAYAVEIELLKVEENPSRLVKPFQDPPHRDRFLSPEEAQRLLSYVDASASPILKYLIPFLLLTGARRGEAIHAEWTHIDFIKRDWVVPVSKNGRPRHITLSNGAVKILEKVYAFTREKLGETKYVFPNIATGKPYHQIYYAWDTARRKAGLRDVRMHDLRHSYASILVNQGIPLYDVKELLGHSNITTTQRYAHLSRDRLMESASAAEVYMRQTI